MSMARKGRFVELWTTYRRDGELTVTNKQKSQKGIPVPGSVRQRPPENR